MQLIVTPGISLDSASAFTKKFKKLVCLWSSTVFVFVLPKHNSWILRICFYSELCCIRIIACNESPVSKEFRSLNWRLALFISSYRRLAMTIIDEFYQSFRSIVVNLIFCFRWFMDFHAPACCCVVFSNPQPSRPSSIRTTWADRSRWRRTVIAFLRTQYWACSDSVLHRNIWIRPVALSKRYAQNFDALKGQSFKIH